MEKKRFASPFLKQAFVASGAVLNVVGHGCVIGFSAVLLPQLKKPDSKIPMDHHSASWIASVVGFALMLGNIITPYIMERKGRRFAHKLTTLPITIGWFVIIYSRSVSQLIFGRFLQGLSMGMQAPLGVVLLAESVSPRNRGVFLGGLSLALAIGILASHVIGTYFNWTWTALICSLTSSSSFIIISFSPETPSWLATKGRIDECRKSYHWLRGNSEEDNHELEVMINNIIQNKIEDKNDSPKNLLFFFKVIGKEEFFKPTLITIHLYILYQLSGNNVFASYTIDIVNSLFGKTMDSYTIMNIIDGVRLASAITSCMVVKRFKRKTMINCSTLLCIVSLLGMASSIYFSLHTVSIFIPSLSVICFISSIALGIIPLSQMIAGEIFPVAYRSLGGAISTLFLSSMFFASVKSAPYMFKDLGIHGSLVCYAMVSLYCLIVVNFLLPETKDKTLTEIENYFTGFKFEPVPVVKTEPVVVNDVFL